LTVRGHLRKIVLSTTLLFPQLKKMPNIRIFFVPLVLSMCAALATGQGTLKRITTKTDRLDFGAGGTVAIVGAPNGSIRVEPAARNEVEITAEVEVQAASEADLTMLEGVTGFILQESVGRLAIISVGTNDNKYLKRVAKKFPKRLVGLPFRIDYVIKVPRYCDIQLDNGTGDITVFGIEGNHRINSLESNARIDLVGGTLNATIGKGKVDVTLPDRSWRGGPITIALASGDMNVELPVTLSAELDASVLRTGKIENSLPDLKPRVRTVKFTDQSIIARAGSGGVAIKFTVGDGTLRLRTIGRSN
jgi:hypothetical protein